MSEQGGEKVLSMFGQPDDVLLANLDALRRRLCQYGPDAKRCDCKFGASGKGEQSGCPELRQAIAIISGQREQVAITRELFEQSAANTLRHIERILAEHSATPELGGSHE